MNNAPIIDFDFEIAKAIAEQCICHPASRGIDDIERAGEAIKYLLWVLERRTAIESSAPAWHDAPTVPGIWLCDEGNICYEWTAHSIEILDQFEPGEGFKWFGPIPEDQA